MATKKTAKLKADYYNDLVDRLAWEAIQIASEGRLIHGQLEKLRSLVSRMRELDGKSP